MPIWDESKLSELDEIENLDEWADENVPKQIHLNIPTEDSDELAEINVQQEKGNKTSENDMRMFKTQVKQLANWCKSNPVFEMEVFPKIIENSFTTYFNHYDLFDYLSKYPQPEEEIFLKVTIDNPQIPPALNEADYLGKIILEEERLRIEEEQKRNQEEKERADKEEQERLDMLQKAEDEKWAGLDEKTIQLIKDKIEETREIMMKKLDEKKTEYAEKLHEAKNSKGKKK